MRVYFCGKRRNDDYFSFDPNIIIKNTKSTFTKTEPSNNEVKGEGLISYDTIRNISRKNSLEFIIDPCILLKLTIMSVSTSCLFYNSTHIEEGNSKSDSGRPTIYRGPSFI
jgi:hypothetical protein